MITRTLALAVAVTLAVVLLSIASISTLEAQSGICALGVHFYNKDRMIRRGGIITAECQGSIHTAPFGNWGVRSNHGSITNKNQFRGWNRHGSQRHWNSCTHRTAFAPPSTRYY